MGNTIGLKKWFHFTRCRLSPIVTRYNSGKPCTGKILNNLEIMFAEIVIFKIWTNKNHDVSPFGNGLQKSTARDNQGGYGIEAAISRVGWWWSNVVWQKWYSEMKGKTSESICVHQILLYRFVLHCKMLMSSSWANLKMEWWR